MFCDNSSNMDASSEKKLTNWLPNLSFDSLSTLWRQTMGVDDKSSKLSQITYCPTGSDLEKGAQYELHQNELPRCSKEDALSDIPLPQPACIKPLLSTATGTRRASCIIPASQIATNCQDLIKKRNLCSSNDKTKHKEPSPKYSYEWINILRWEWLSVYRRLNLLVLLVNITIVVVFAAQRRLLHLDPGNMATALAANVTTAVIFRQEYIVNALFLLFGCCSPDLPLWIRRLAAKIYHFGGVHSGAGMASIIWLALFDMSIIFSYRQYNIEAADVGIILISAALNLLLCSIVVSSYPRFRERYHNIWESIHRFGGWLAVALFWINFGLLINQDHARDQPGKFLTQKMITSPTFWMLLVITVCLILPWLRLRKVPVYAEWQSKYAIRLHFNYTNLPLCAAPRFSTSPLMEWHSFAGIPAENGQGFSVLVSGVGDWTRSLIANPPKQLWTRGIPVRGVLHIAPIFRKIVLVATGSGIGPILSLLHARDVDCRVLWCTRDPSQTYQPDVLDQVLKADPDAHIIARVKGQRDPDLGRLAYHLYQQSGAEAIFVISNKEGCFKARIWLESRGVVVFTPIFDS